MSGVPQISIGHTSAYLTVDIQQRRRGHIFYRRTEETIKWEELVCVNM